MKVTIFVTVISSLSFSSNIICLEVIVEHLSHPTFKKPENAVNINQLQYAQSTKEIVTAVSTFYPADKSHDFTLMRFFTFSRGDAKTTLIEFERLNKSLRQILDHFASIYLVR